MEIPKIEISAEKIADKVLDEIEFKGKNIREWAEYLIRNADDLISRQAAIECLKTKIAEIFFKETAEKNVEKWLNELPTVQPEQKTGRWVTQFDGTLHYCSECGWALMDTESGDLPYMGIDYHRSNEERWTCCPGWCEELMNYCPNCGAKMEGVK